LNETLRINGEAIVTNDKELLELAIHDGKAPQLGILNTRDDHHFNHARSGILCTFLIKIENIDIKNPSAATWLNLTHYKKAISIVM
jgi:predicted nuclease of predicted toxin-antitoxin system